MRWKSWLLRTPERLRAVAGLDLSTDTCRLVIVSGSLLEPAQVCCAVCLDVPEAWVSQGQIAQADLLGHWLQGYLVAQGYVVSDLCMGIDDAFISIHEFELTAGLKDEDVVFQLSVEVQNVWPDVDVCVDFELMPPLLDAGDPVTAKSQSYQVHVVPRPQVAAIERMAKAAQLCLTRVEGRHDAQRRMQIDEVTLPSSPGCESMSAQYEVAFGLAMGAWQLGAINFLPYRERAQDVLRRDWRFMMTAWALGGIFFAAGLTWVLSMWGDSKQSDLADIVAVERALDAASQSHRQALSVHQAATEQARWLQMRQIIHQHTLQWTQVLNQAAHGIWVSGLTQQGTRWDVQGEALTSGHAHALLTQLKGLHIWVRAPELRQLQLLRPTANMGLPVWQFRIEAELKAAP